jgi:DNA-binding NarL/FixJ family response regulator
LSGEGHDVRSADDVGNACREVRLLEPHVVVLSLDDRSTAAPDVAACRRIADALGTTRVLPIARSQNVHLARRVLDAGACGLFDMNLGLDLIGRAVRAVVEGEIWLPRSLVGSLLLRDPDQEGEPADHRPLTTREEEVLLLLADGRDHHAIATALALSPHTARTHIRNVLRKLGAHSRLEAVAVAEARGLLLTPET